MRKSQLIALLAYTSALGASSAAPSFTELQPSHYEKPLKPADARRKAESKRMRKAAKRLQETL